MEYHPYTGSPIPQNLTNSMAWASLSFVVAVWLLVTLSTRNIKTSLKIGAGLGIWYGLVFFLGRMGFFGATIFNIPMIAVGFVTTAILLKTLYSNSFVQKTFDALPLHWVMAVQIFRLMGYGFLVLHSLGLIPGIFALPTGWGDVAIGLTAPVVALLWATRKAKSLAVLWNYLGIADLALALTLGIGTYPRPVQALATTPNNELIALFPLVMVPLFAVPLSILLHLLTLRALKKT